MESGVYDLKPRKGDTYYGPLITLPDLSTYGGPNNLEGAEVTAEFRYRENSEEPFLIFELDMVDAAARKVRPRLSAEATATIEANGYWRLRVEYGGWAGSPLRGRVIINRR